jgi:hypothetical protein
MNILFNGNPNNTAQSPTIPLSTVIPRTSIAADLCVNSGDADGTSWASIFPVEYQNPGTQSYGQLLSLRNQINVIFIYGNLILGPSRNIYWWGADDDDNVFNLYAIGWMEDR